MANILVLREPNRPFSAGALLEHQAIISIARSVLAGRIRSAEPDSSDASPRSGMRLSGHSLLVPADTDILPLLALVADDYWEMEEPELRGGTQQRPIVLYGELEGLSPEDREMIETFSRSDLFQPLSPSSTLANRIREYPLAATVYLGDPARGGIRIEGNSDLGRVIGFSAFRRSQEYLGIPNNMEFADQAFGERMRAHLREFRISPEDEGRLGFWAGQYDNESLPELEQFIPFGPAFEMLMWQDNTE